METFLFIILTILVQHTIQYENAEKGNLLHPEKPPEEHEDSHNLRKGDIKYLTNIKDYDTGDFKPYNGRYQNYYRKLKDKEIMRPLRELRSASDIKNWVKDMIAMRRKRKGPNRPRPPHTSKKPRPPHTSKKPRPPHTTSKSKGDRDYIRISASFEPPEEEQILLEYTPKHKKVDVPMIIFVPSRE